MHETTGRILGCLALAALPFVTPAQAEEVRPGVLRTPEARFEHLEGFPYAPNYLQVGDIRLHYVDVGPRDAETLLLIHGEPTWSYLFRTSTRCRTRIRPQNRSTTADRELGGGRRSRCGGW